MRVLLSTIGSRGDVQPFVALALALKARGEDVHVCVPPDFREWIEGLGIHVTTIGPALRATAKPSQPMGMPTAEQRQAVIDSTVAAQFEILAAAADGSDVIIGATALQIAAPSIAERAGVPYVFAAYCAAVLPSTQHAPAVLTMLGDKPAANVDYPSLWKKDAQRWNQTWGEIINRHRAALGLPAIDQVRDYVITKRPWLAADATLGPWRDDANEVFQTGAWILADNSPLPAPIEAFLDAGDPPIYFGFGSIRAPAGLCRAVIDSARALGRRAIVSRGWADLALIDDAKDCLSIGDVNHQALFKRVAAVHHGGAGTTTAAAHAGAPQVIIPQHYDQFYWAQRIQELGIGATHIGSTPTTESLTRTLAVALQSDVAARAKDIAMHVRSDGADVAAQAIEAL